MNNQNNGENGNTLATLSAIIGVGGVGFSVVLIGVPLCILAIILAQKTFKKGNFGTYTDYDEHGFSSTFSYSFRAKIGMICGIIGCVIGFGILFVGVFAGFME